MKKKLIAMSNEQRCYVYRYNETKEKLYPISFIYVWTTFEHQVQHIYESQKFQVFYGFRGSETQFSRAGAFIF